MSQAFKVLRWGSLLAAAPILVALAGPPDGGEPANARVTEGSRLFAIYCAACHGEKARGDGPTAAVLKTRPTDLTRLSAKNGKEFPSTRVHEAIDGRGLEHGTREMPLWGLAFQDWGSDASQEREIRERIDALAAWIESIQR